MKEWRKILIVPLLWVHITLAMPIFRSTCEVEAGRVLPPQLVCPAWSFWQPFVIGQLSPSPANTPGALAFLLVVKYHCWHSLTMDGRWWAMVKPDVSSLRMKPLALVVWHSLPSPQNQTVFAFCLLSALSSFFLYFFLHLLLPICWLRSAGPAIPTLMSLPHLGQHAVVTLYLILSFDHLAYELQLLSVNICTFVFANGMLGYNVGRSYTMMNRFPFCCLVQCTKVFEWSWTSVSMAHTSARCHRASKIEFQSNLSKKI